MLSSFRVQGFKSLLDAKVELGLVNVFIGANGSGKSNLLEAFGVLGATIHGAVEPETLRYRGVRLGIPASYKTSFKHEPSKRLELQAEWGCNAPGSSSQARYFVEFENLLLSSRLRWQIEGESLSDQGRQLLFRDSRECNLYARTQDIQQVRISREQSAAELAVRIQSDDVVGARELLAALKGFAIYSPTTPVLRGVADDITREPLGLGGSGLAQVVEELLENDANQLGPFDLDDVWELIEWAEDLSAVPATRENVSPALKSGPEVILFRDRFMSEAHQFVSIFDASEGALYVLFMLALVGHKDAPSLFAVDNFDQALHPRLACALTRLICDQMVEDGTRQFLATTHNPLVLDGLNLLDDRIRLFAIDRDAGGATQVKRIEVSEQLMAQAESGLSLSRLWVMGRLGGVPQSL